MSDETITSDAQSEVLEQVLPKISQLEEELQQENPQIDQYLKFINDDLRQYPELVHLLSEDQIKPIYSAIREKTDVTISVKASKKKGVSGKLDDGRSVGDLL